MAHGQQQVEQGSHVERVRAEEARRRVAEGRAFLVCAYEDESKCQRMRLDGALTLRELQDRLATLPKSQEIIFYCA